VWAMSIHQFLKLLQQTLISYFERRSFFQFLAATDNGKERNYIRSEKWLFRFDGIFLNIDYSVISSIE
jgi:hypothetical protein